VYKFRLATGLRRGLPRRGRPERLEQRGDSYLAAESPARSDTSSGIPSNCSGVKKLKTVLASPFRSMARGRVELPTPRFSDADNDLGWSRAGLEKCRIRPVAVRWLFGGSRRVWGTPEWHSGTHGRHSARRSPDAGSRRTARTERDNSAALRDGERRSAEQRYSYWSASRTSSRPARRAGSTAARTPATRATATKASSVVRGREN